MCLRVQWKILKPLDTVVEEPPCFASTSTKPLCLVVSRIAPKICQL